MWGKREKTDFLKGSETLMFLEKLNGRAAILSGG